ncbi:asparagine synthase (glutamine-hydrolyzing) [Microaerobacter geothermalis]|uniref:asparagine synthase (glutamine-hydrolyzing) n=1 Tax=Microaerobacter geothermalis TaxID=674972 RepID=UPI001F39C500|nr:asparagine synthase (glutamine-hydrolyzing) [Microaerobacter geothermalis]MCF6092988.1 asparagine synthase (glutamine-hydrolyzing) [Microaerobacter geothermalis]
MCGITGWVDWEVDLRNCGSIIDKMTDSMTNRGPDAKGIWLSTQAALGHRRLVVVDPIGGGQPMIRKWGNTTYVLVYNGELYNTVELRHKLMAKGHRFDSHSDTEVLLTSYIEWGASCVYHLNGIFAFAIWNEEEQRLFLARDRLGVKPLFYSKSGSSGFLFASEIKALLQHPEVTPQIDEVGLAEIFALGPMRTPGIGVFRGISELKPGYSLDYDRKGIRTTQYWKLHSEIHQDDEKTTIHHVRDLFKDTVERQLISDVPVCTLLSGGLDSSAITAFAAHELKRTGQETMDTYSVDYLDNDQYFQPNQFQPNSDAPWAKLVSEALKTQHHVVTIDTPQLVDALKMAVFARDLPGMADVDGSLYLFAKEIKKKATVALSGECADEIFGGYPWFHREHSLNADTFPWSRNFKERSSFLSQELISKIQPEIYIKERYLEALKEVPRLPGENPHDARIREMFYLNITRWMPTLLDRKDRMSMAASLEIRVPFCDHRLVEYAWNIPWKIKCLDGREKGILRTALQGVLPDKVLTRRKSPYPKTHHPAYLAATREWMLEILHDSDSPLHPFINVSKLREFALSDVSNIDMPWFGQLMNVPQLFAYFAQVHFWLKEYKVQIV